MAIRALHITDNTGLARSAAGIDFTGATGLTLMCAVKIGAGDNRQASTWSNCIALVDHAATDAYTMAVQPKAGIALDATLQPEFTANNGTWLRATGAAALSRNTWHVLALTLSFGPSGYTLKGYVDGTLVGTLTGGTAYTFSGMTWDLRMAGASGPDNYDVSVCDVRVFTAAHDASTVADASARAISDDEKADAALIAYIEPQEQAGGDTSMETAAGSAGPLTLAGSYTWDGAIPAYLSPAGTPAKLALRTQPSGASAGFAMFTQPVVEVQDAGGNLCLSATNAVTAALTGTGSLSGTATVDAVAGVATFTDLAIDTAGTGDTLTFSASGLTGVTSAAFDVSATPDVPGDALTVKPMCLSCAFFLDPDAAQMTVTSAVLQWRLHDADAWKTAQPFQAIGNGDGRWSCMLFGLTEGLTVQYKVYAPGTAFDASNAWTGTFTTLTHAVPTGGAATLSLTPSDTVRTAIAGHLTGTPATDGAKVIELAGGRYRQDLWGYYTGGGFFDYSGTSASWLLIRGKSGERVIFDGSDPAFDKTQAENGGTALWELYTDAGKGIDASHQIYRSVAALAYEPYRVYYEKPGDFDGDAWQVLRLTPGEVFGSAQNTATGLTGAYSMLARAVDTPYEPSFSYEADGHLYLRLHDGADPNTVRVKIPYIQSCFDLQGADAAHLCSHVKLKDIEFRYFGARDVNANQWGGAHIAYCSDIVLENVSVSGCLNAFGCRPNSAASSPRNRCVLYGCAVKERGLYPEPDGNGGYKGIVWEHIKASGNEGVAFGANWQGCSILNATVQGPFNGVTWGGDSTVYGHTEGLEVDSGAFYGVGDDCLEMEDWSVAVAYTRNRGARCYHMWSAAPIMGGPVYFLRNTYYNVGEYASSAYKAAMWKIGNSAQGTLADQGYKLSAHNTCVNLRAGALGDQDAGVGYCGEGETTNFHGHNDYVACQIMPVDWSDGALGYPHAFDGNAYFVADPGHAPTGFGGFDGVSFMGQESGNQGDTGAPSGARRSDTLAHWQEGYNSRTPGESWPGYDGTAAETPRDSGFGGTWLHDPHSVMVSGDHDLVDPAGGDFRPLDGSHAEGVGRALANINVDCGPGWAAYEEATPTAGAVPAGGSSPAANTAPTITAADVSGTLGTRIEIAYAASDPDAGDSVASVTAALTAKPAGSLLLSANLVVDAANARVHFQADVAGSYTVTLTATDTHGATATAAPTVTVAAPAVSAPQAAHVYVPVHVRLKRGATPGTFSPVTLAYAAGDTVPTPRALFYEEDGTTAVDVSGAVTWRILTRPVGGTYSEEATEGTAVDGTANAVDFPAPAVAQGGAAGVYEMLFQVVWRDEDGNDNPETGLDVTTVTVGV